MIKKVLYTLFRIKKVQKGEIVISRLSDLLRAGFSPSFLADEFLRIDSEVWGEITDDSRYLRTRDIVLTNFIHCPDIIYCAFEDGIMVGTLTNMYLEEEKILAKTSWYEKTAGGTLANHKRSCETALGVDLTVVKTASRRVSERLVLTALVVSLLGGGLKAVFVGSRIPAYHKNSHLSVREYVSGRRPNGKPLDPELYFYLKNGFKIARIIPNYMNDPQSLNYGVMVRWDNPFYKLTKIFPPLKHLIKKIGEMTLLGLPHIK